MIAQVKKGDDVGDDEQTMGYAHKGEINEASLRMETLNYVTWTEKVNRLVSCQGALHAFTFRLMTVALIWDVYVSSATTG